MDAKDITIETVDLARIIAIIAHAGQVDKAGDSYSLHPQAVAQNVMKYATSPEEKTQLVAAALLHDVLEDTDVSEATLLELGIPRKIVAVVRVLSRGDGESYDDFIERIAQSRLASKVRLADLEHNLDGTRRWQPGGKHRQRYIDAKRYLEDVLNARS